MIANDTMSLLRRPVSSFLRSLSRSSGQERALVTVPTWSEGLAFASPESDFTSSPYSLYHQRSHSTSPNNASWSHSLSFASPESDFCGYNYNYDPATEAQSAQLPRTLRDALMEEHQAIIVTTASSPHRIVHVNHAWENLCGYTKQEALHQTLRLLQGPHSNLETANTVAKKLDATHEPQECYLVNYTKSGREFINHVRAGPLFLNENDSAPLYMVGIVEEVDRESVPLRMAM